MSAVAASRWSSSPATPGTTTPPPRAMSVTQTYYLAHTARGKLSSEAARADHNLRLLVGHANLLDGLMLELAAAESEQEQWFTQSVPPTRKPDEPRHIQWADTIVEEPEEDWRAEDADTSDTDSDCGSDDEEMEILQLQRVHSILVPVPVPAPAEVEEEEEEEEDDGEEDLESLQLHLTPSRSQSPPELDHDSDSSEDEAMPPSPPSDTLPTFADQPQKPVYVQPSAVIPASEQQAFFDEGFYLPRRTTRPGVVSAIRVY
ncbi:hypothetical protein BUE80_DR004919 [Diplocarpon rosae]|nr:hypothetical protein BUE80_DR004919 [Diplocarpon rosae]